MKSRILIIVMFICISVHGQNITPEQNKFDKMSWFSEAKLGIFIHWGIYSVKGISESWSFFNEYISHQDYLNQLDSFDAINYNPKKWVELIKNSGAKYAVITSKHHDGFALWKTKYGNLNSVNNSASKKDLLTPFINELKRNKLKLGLYYSLPDWSFNDYDNFTKNKKRYLIHEEPKRWEKFLAYRDNQLFELNNLFNPDIWWFDGDWEHSAQEWKSLKLKQILLEKNPKVIINSRLNNYGDYDTPEIGVPIYRPKSNYWELCLTINDSWGYQKNDKNYKSSMQIIDIFVDVISKGGNLLLNIGPKADGTIPKQQEAILKDLGKWIKKHESAIYKTKRGIPYDHFYGPTTLNKKEEILYLFVRDLPKDNKIVLKGIENKINRAYILGDGTILNKQLLCKVYWNKYPGISYLEIPRDNIDPYYTVVAVVLDGPIKLFKEKTGAIESN